MDTRWLLWCKIPFYLYAMHKSKQRGQELKKIAYDLGMEYSPEDEYDLPDQLRDFRLFRRGMRKRVSHVLRRQEELMEYDIRVFDYRYLKWMGKAAKRFDQTVFYLHSTKLGLPEMWLRPETIFHKIGELFGRGDIDFIRHPKFSGQYRLTGGDEHFVRHHFTDEVLNYFTVEKGWSIEGVGYYLLIYKKNKILTPKEIFRFYHHGLEVFRMLTDEDEQNKIFGT